MIQRRSILSGMASALALSAAKPVVAITRFESLATCDSPINIGEHGFLKPLKRNRLQDNDELKTLEQAYAVLRAKGVSTSPAGLQTQEWVHRTGCGVSTDHNMVHFSGMFFLWHRWFLFFHERSLGAALGFSSPVVLPYWDKVLYKSITVPTYLDRPAFARLRLIRSSHPSKDLSIDVDPTPMLANLHEADNLDALYKTVVLQWHNSVHTYLSVKLGRKGFWETKFAAGDPLFYFFHAAVDWIFEYWRCLTGTRTAEGQCIKNSTVGLEMAHCFRFWDALTKAFVTVKANDALRLNYVYDSQPDLVNTNDPQIVLRLIDTNLNIPNKGLKLQVFDSNSGKAISVNAGLSGFGEGRDAEVNGISAVFRLPQEQLPDNPITNKPSWDVWLEEADAPFLRRARRTKLTDRQWRLEPLQSVTLRQTN